MLARVVASLLIASVAWAVDPSQPHVHTGKFEAFTHSEPTPLSAAELAGLEAGQPVQKTVQLDSGVGARAVTVFDVEAPLQVVWTLINDIRAYPKMVPSVADVQVYKESKSGGRQLTWVTYTLSVLGYKIAYYLELSAEERSHTMTFKLDYSRLSDIDDTIGYWHLRSIKDGSATRVTYSVGLMMRGWWPKPVINTMLASGLGRATAWVGIESLKRAPKTATPAGGASRCRWSWRRFRRVCESAPPKAAPPQVAASQLGGVDISRLSAIAIVLVSFCVVALRFKS